MARAGRHHDAGDRLASDETAERRVRRLKRRQVGFTQQRQGGQRLTAVDAGIAAFMQMARPARGLAACIVDEARQPPDQFGLALGGVAGLFGFEIFGRHGHLPSFAFLAPEAPLARSAAWISAHGKPETRKAQST
jgi:hypothetical protein